RAPSGAHRVPPRRARGGAAAPRAGDRRPVVGRSLSQPVVRPAVRAGARREPRGRGVRGRVVTVRVPITEQRDASYDIRIGSGLGGGLVGDWAGFVAATCLRGVPYVQVPTSLLAMIDSAIGGKTGVDVPAGKNLLGAFHQPGLVVADLDVLASLPAAQLAAGMAEAVKHGVIADAAYFGFLEGEHRAVLARDAGVLERVVARSVQIKADVVAADEREAGRRATLNFGHTVGHAIEATSKFAVLHGEAVAIGMAYEARLAEALEIAERGTGERIRGALERYGLPLELPDPAAVQALLAAMQVDKKARAGTLRFALPRAIGSMHGGLPTGWT